ncbi:MAG TPA: 50S ribosomal protein L19 [Candidatus Paceibacterota bacterium]|nr:50S ribosomal protein L19 [Candidatus Paceibacterota bacterium]
MSQQLIQAFAAKHNPKNRWPELKPGMTVRVHQKLKQGEKGKASVFEGIIIARKHGDEPGATITVRRAVGGYGVEKVYPLRLPTIEKIEVVKVGRTRRAKMYYLRGKSTREIRKKTRAEQAQLKVLTAVPAPTEEPAPEEEKAE